MIQFIAQSKRESPISNVDNGTLRRIQKISYNSNLTNKVSLMSVIYTTITLNFLNYFNNRVADVVQKGAKLRVTWIYFSTNLVFVGLVNETRYNSVLIHLDRLTANRLMFPLLTVCAKT